MQLSEFIFDLPPHLIAKYPTDKRTDSRLLLFNNNKINDLIFKDIINLFNPGDLLVLNNTKVIPARFYGQKPTGAKIEFLLERVLDNQQALVYIKANKKSKPDLIINLDNSAINNQYSITILEKQDNLYLIKLNQENITWFDLLDSIGKLPLPPYINRNLEAADQQRYQTVYAEHVGAVAAPTAGLHFDQELLNLIQQRGVEIKYITLHVGSGTFQPVRVDNILEHKMHSESYKVEPDLINSIIKLKQNNLKHNKSNKIIAVGTTSLRCLESLVLSLDETNINNNPDLLKQTKLSGDTDIFIYPGFKFKLVDSLITNFHLPGSSLIMLVSAFVGLDNIKYCYNHAIENSYRFYSYGDAMWLNKKV